MSKTPATSTDRPKPRLAGHEASSGSCLHRAQNPSRGRRRDPSLWITSAVITGMWIHCFRKRFVHNQGSALAPGRPRGGPLAPVRRTSTPIPNRKATQRCSPTQDSIHELASALAECHDLSVALRRTETVSGSLLQETS